MIYHDPEEDRPDHFTDNEPETPSAAPQPAAGSGADDPFAPVGSTIPTPKPRRRRLRRFMVWLAVTVVMVLAAAIWIRYFHPYAIDAQTTGFVTGMEKRGIIFKTTEGDLLSSERIADTTHVYQRDFHFSVTDDSLARVIRSHQGTGKPVRLTFKRYYAPVAWRGASTCVVTAVEPL